MSSSLDGSGPGSALLRTNLSCDGPVGCPPMSAFHTVAGASVASSASLRGPVRRSINAAMDVRQLFAAIARWASVISNCTSFSASAKVAGETSGPTGGAVLKAGGAPGVADCCVAGVCSSPRHAAITPSRPRGAWMRNCRREFTIGNEEGTDGSGAARIGQSRVARLCRRRSQTNRRRKTYARQRPFGEW